MWTLPLGVGNIKQRNPRHRYFDVSALIDRPIKRAGISRLLVVWGSLDANLAPAEVITMRVQVA